MLDTESDETEAVTMTQDTVIRELPGLTREIERYLDAVDAFRAADAAPAWAPEQAVPAWWAGEHLAEARKPGA